MEEGVEICLNLKNKMWYKLLLSFSYLDIVHHFNLGRRMPGFDYGPDGFGTGLTPLHLSDDGEGGAFHFHDPPPPYTAYKYPDIQHPDDPPPPYEASVNPDSILCSTPGMQEVTSLFLLVFIFYLKQTNKKTIVVYFSDCGEKIQIISIWKRFLLEVSFSLGVVVWFYLSSGKVTEIKVESMLRAA